MASKLDRWLATASRSTLAFIAIAAGIIFIVLSNPPQTICDQQVAAFEQNQKEFLFTPAPQVEPGETPTGARRGRAYSQLYSLCRANSGPGGCYELFASLHRMIRALNAATSDCEEKMGEVGQVRRVLWSSVDFMVRAAWGSKPPAMVDRRGWLDTADVALYCQMKQKIISYYGKDEWDRYRETLFTHLPGVKGLSRQDAWPLMLVSQDCGNL